MTRRRRRWEQRRWLGPANRRLALMILGVGTAAFLLGYAATAVLVFPGSSTRQIVAVPELRGLARADARVEVEQAGLELVVGDTLAHPSVPRGSVLAQSPLPGQEVIPNSGVTVILSTGPDRRPVPDVIAMTDEQARRILEGSGFRVHVEEVTNEAEAGQVVSMRPAPGTPLIVPAPVRLTVSSGPPLVEVPSLLGLPLPEARQRLAERGLAAAEPTYEFRGWESTGDVLEQEPQPGDSIPAGSPVQITVGEDPLRFFRRRDGDEQLPRREIRPGTL